MVISQLARPGAQGYLGARAPMYQSPSPARSLRHLESSSGESVGSARSVFCG